MWTVGAQELLTKHVDAVRKVAELLLVQETISQHDIIALVGPRPFASDVSPASVVLLSMC